MFESKINRGRANGYAPLGSSGKVPLDYLPPIQSTLDTGAFATTGSNTFTGTQTISGTSGTGGQYVGLAELTIGQAPIIGQEGFGIRASGFGGVGLALTSDDIFVAGMSKDSDGSGNDGYAIINAQTYYWPFSYGPTVSIATHNSGSEFGKYWVYENNGISYIPGDVNIGYDVAIIPTTSGSLNIRNGNINVSGSVNINSGSLNVKGNSSFTGNINLSGSLNISSSMIISSTVVNNGNIEAVNSDLIIDGGDIVLSGSFAQQVNYAPMASGSWLNPSTDITQLDITKDIHLLDVTGIESANAWFLPDGLYDGQVVRFALKGDGTANQSLVRVYMNNLRTANGTIQSDVDWAPFYCDEAPTGPCRSLATALYIDGAWNIDTDWWDMGY
jgi:hypothetical protein